MNHLQADGFLKLLRSRESHSNFSDLYDGGASFECLQSIVYPNLRFPGRFF
jgi:hypothetical protein